VASQETCEVLVDDLADESDYWLSITDASRVTRKQEITIRRWIAKGELPVRRQRMGHNKRTRHVRASDLADLTPIIDPLAAITGAPANADLMSIPKQQADLLLGQRALQEAIEGVLERMTRLMTDVRDQEQRQEQSLSTMQTTLEETGERWHQELVDVQTAMARTYEALHDKVSLVERSWEVKYAQLSQDHAAELQRLERLIEHSQATLRQDHEQFSASWTAQLRQVGTQLAEMEKQGHDERASFAKQLGILQTDLVGMQQSVTALSTGWESRFTTYEQTTAHQAEQLREVSATLASMQELIQSVMQEKEQLRTQLTETERRYSTIEKRLTQLEATQKKKKQESAQS
jgi:hypothetical protein